MIKNKTKIFLTLLIATLIFNVNSVFAGNATAKLTSNTKTGIKFKNGGNYYDSRFTITPNNGGATRTAYCVDPGYSATSAGWDVTCSSAGKSSALYCIIKSNKSDTAKQLAIRMYASNAGKLSKNLTAAGKAVQAYATDSSALTSSNESEKQILKDATELYNSCNDNKKTELTSSSGEISFGAQNVVSSDANGHIVKIPISATPGTVKRNELEISCESNACSVEILNWNKSTGSGEIKVTITDPSVCDYTLQAFLPDKTGSNGSSCEVFYCMGQKTWQSVVYCGDPDEVKTPAGKKKYKVGGDFGKIYCDNKDCKEETKIEIPYFCDDSENNKLTVTAPIDAKSCIIGGYDEAGNSYQDGSVKSKYCSVYCKEDYEISLPGAQYTNSGEYFDLNPTKIKLTKTCYAGGPKGAVGGIDRDQYIEDIQQQQKDLIDAYNKYSERKAQTAAVAAGSADSTLETKDCDENTYYKKTKSNIPYTAYKITGCSNSTGVCTIAKDGNAKTEVTWGKEYATTPDSSISNSATSLDGYSCTQNSNGKYNCTRACSSTLAFDDEDGPDPISFNTVKNKQTIIEKTITDYKKCFNWNFDVCLNEIVDFDYSEPYSDIDYSEVPNTETKGDISYAYGTDLSGSNIDGDVSLETIMYTGCDEESGCSLSTEATKISTKAKYTKETRNGYVEYDNTTQFKTNYPHGTIDTVTNPDDVKSPYEYLGAVFPVALKRDQGVYNWTLSFKNLGEKFADGGCSTGRIDEVANAIGKTLNTELGYACVYVVDCDDCDYECVCPDNLPTGYECVVTKTDQEGQICEFTEPTPKCPDCDVYCINCIFDGDDAYNYRTISLSDINPTNRTLGYNWSNYKGQETKKDIEKVNESAYKKPEYSYTLTATQMKEIRDYNKAKGTYIASDLTYQDKTINGKKYTNLVGLSTFLDEDSKKYFTENTRNDDWTPWTGAMEDGVGPAWK